MHRPAGKPNALQMLFSPSEKNCLRMRTDGIVFWYVAFDLHSEIQWPESFSRFIWEVFTRPIESYIKAVEADVDVSESILYIEGILYVSSACIKESVIKLNVEIIYIIYL